MTIKEIKIGSEVESLRDFSGVPKGTNGYIIDDYGTGITIGWDLPKQPYPKYLKPEIVAALFGVNPLCPVRDGFDKKTELKFLKIKE